MTDEEPFFQDMISSSTSSRKKESSSEEGKTGNDCEPEAYGPKPKVHDRRSLEYTS
jgi:hypothetical protein